MPWGHPKSHVLSNRLVYLQINKSTARMMRVHTTLPTLPDLDIHPATRGKIIGQGVNGHEIDSMVFGPKTSEGHGIL
jgi:hypothetical protein